MVTDSLGNICVTCLLLPASPAPACVAVFTNTHNESVDQPEILLPAPTFSSCINLPPGEYGVDLKDVNSSGHAEIGVAYHIQKLVTVNSTTTYIPGACMLTIIVELYIPEYQYHLLIGAV